MGVIAEQSVKSTFSYYLGMFLGALNTIVLYPLIFNNNPEFLGLIQILLAYAVIFSTFSNLSLPAIIIKFFPVVEKKSQLFFFSLLLAILGFSVFSLIYIYVLKDLVLTGDDQALMMDYAYYILPIVFFISFFDVLTAISRSYLDASTPIFLNEVFLRVYSIIALLLYGLGLLEFSVFIKVYFVGYMLKFILLLFVLLRHDKLSMTFEVSDLQVKKMMGFGFYVILGSTSALLISKIDMLMLGKYLDLQSVAQYTVAFYIGNAIMVPARSIISISSPLLADAWKAKNLALIKTIYVKSSINQLIIGGLFFLCIWVNIDHLMLLFPDKFSDGKYIVLFIGVSRLITLASGVNSAIVINSSYYKFDLLLNIPFLIFIIVSNHFLIPYYGINGAALATLISTLLFNGAKILFVRNRLKMHPFSMKTVYVILLLFLVYLIIDNIQLPINIYVSILVKTLLSLVLFIPLMYKMLLSVEINKMIFELKNRLWQR